MTVSEMLQLVPGSVIKSPTGNLRTVCAVSKQWLPIGRGSAIAHWRVCATVPIKVCSWTHRPHTTLNHEMLKAYSFTGIVLAIRRFKLARLVIEDAKGAERCGTCCDVIGKFT